MASSSSSNNIHHIRSISLPTESHPATFQVEEELYNLKTWEASTSEIPTVESICSCLSGMERLYKCVNDVLSLPLAQRSLSNNLYEKLVDELLDRSMRLLDVCGSTRDAMSQVREHVIDVQSAKRRKKGDLSTDTSFAKKTKKGVKSAISALKQIDNKICNIAALDLDHDLSGLIRSLRDANSVSISLFRSLLSFISMSVSKPKSTRWSIVSRLINKGTTESESQPKSLKETLESDIEVIENGLECMFRSLIKTRASLLNIRSH